MHDDWFRWIAGVVMAALTGAAGWLSHMIFRNKDEIVALKIKIAVLESRPVVDPIELAKSMAQMAAAVTQLSVDVKHLVEVKDATQVMVRELRAEIDILAEAVTIVQRDKPGVSR